MESARASVSKMIHKRYCVLLTIHPSVFATDVEGVRQQSGCATVYWSLALHLRHKRCLAHALPLPPLPQIFKRIGSGWGQCHGMGCGGRDKAALLMPQGGVGGGLWRLAGGGRRRRQLLNCTPRRRFVRCGRMCSRATDGSHWPRAVAVTGRSGCHARRRHSRRCPESDERAHAARCSGWKLLTLSLQAN